MLFAVRSLARSLPAGPAALLPKVPVFAPLATALVGVGAVLGLGATPPAGAIPRQDLKPYPAPLAGERRWVVQLPGVLPPSRDSGISASPEDWRVELIVGRNLEVDCNHHLFRG